MFLVFTNLLNDLMKKQFETVTRIALEMLTIS